MSKKIKHGKRFEEDFIKSVPDRCDVTRLKDAGGWSNATNMRFTSSNPCDFIVWSGNTSRMIKLELKSVAGKSMPFSNIKEHQIDGLCKSSDKGVWAWFIVNFRSVNETYCIPALAMECEIDMGGRKSLSLARARIVGRKINQTLIRVRWRYNLGWI